MNLNKLITQIKAGHKVTFMLGAGISTSAGIPDLKTPGTGIYANLHKLNLPSPEVVLADDFFVRYTKEFYMLAEQMFPGKFIPTDFHRLVRLFQDKGLLKRVYTQNVDTLERIAGIRDEFIVNAYGSFASNHCIECQAAMTTEEVGEFILAKQIPACKKCNGVVKPDIVFAGDELSPKFFKSWQKDKADIEIAIVAGTSFTYEPFASLPDEVRGLRVLVNNEKVGNFGDDDIIVIDECDNFARQLCKALGWDRELEELRKAATDKKGITSS